MKQTLFAVLLTLIACSGLAQDLSGFEKVLLPVEPFVGITGAAGTEFRTALHAWAPARFRYYFGGDTIQTFDPIRIIPAPVVTPSQPRSEIGRLLYIEKSAIDSVSMQLRLDSRPAGEPEHLVRVDSVPVVRERDFRTGTIAFANVPFPYVYLTNDVIRPALAQYRHALRIYDVDLRGDAAVRVRVFWTNTGGGGSLQKEAVVALDRRNGSDPSFPYYAVVDLDTFFSSCNPFSLHTPCAGMDTRIELEPVPPGMRYWAFVSMTNNFTQEVTVIAP
jgi:hypothetical protein